MRLYIALQNGKGMEIKMNKILNYIENSFSNIKEINEDGDELEKLLKKCLNEEEIICINDCLNNFFKQQIIQYFINKYKMYIEYTFLYGKNRGGEQLYIKLLKGANLDCKNYQELMGYYDSEYYLSDCGGYDIFNKYKGKKLPDRLLDIYKMTNPSTEEKILDIGCGRGELSYFLSCAGAEVLGLDYSQDSINIAQNAYRNYNLVNLKFECQDIFNINKTGFYDKVVMADVVEHIEQKKLEQLFEKITEILTETGILFIHTAPNRDYYEKHYLSIVKQAKKLEAYLPTNPRTYYEELMHINEQTPCGLEKSLKAHFKYARVWTGSVSTILDIKTQEESTRDMDIYGIATNGNGVLESYLALYSCSPEENEISIDLDVLQKKISAHLGETISVKINLVNTGTVVLNSFGKYQSKISYHIVDDKNRVIIFDGIRTPLKNILKQNMCENTEVSIEIPSNLNINKKYKIQITMVIEGYFWVENLASDFMKEIELDIIV